MPRIQDSNVTSYHQALTDAKIPFTQRADGILVIAGQRKQIHYDPTKDTWTCTLPAIDGFGINTLISYIQSGEL